MIFLSIEQIISGLNSLGFKFQTSGDINKSVSFKSIRHLESNGLYYIQDANSDFINNTFGEIKYSAILAQTFFSTDVSNVIIKIDNPQLAYYHLMNFFHKNNLTPGVHPSSIIHPEAQVSSNAYIGPFCMVGKCIIQDHVIISSHVVIGDHCVIKQGTEIASHVEIGAKGVAWIWDKVLAQRVRQPQLGGVIIGEGCFIGSGVTVVRGSVNESTEIGSGTVIAPGTKIGHGSLIGIDNHFANNVSIAGNVNTGARCFFGSGSVVRPMIHLHDDIVVGAGAVVVKNSTQSYVTLTGIPAIESKQTKEKLSGVPAFLNKEK